MSTRRDLPRFLTTLVVASRPKGAQLYIMVGYFLSYVSAKWHSRVSTLRNGDGWRGCARSHERRTCISQVLISAVTGAGPLSVAFVLAALGVGSLSIIAMAIHRQIAQRIHKLGQL